MKKSKINSISFAAETAVFSLCFLFFLYSLLFHPFSDRAANLIYIGFTVLSFGYLYGFEMLFKKHDIAVHWKMFKKYYVPAKPEAEAAFRPKRKGLAGVIVLWICYLAFIGLLRYTGVLSWQLFLMGASVMFMLNSFFARKHCLLSIVFMKNKNNCCKNCGINSWDYAIFSSALIFAPKLSTAATVVNGVIIALSFFTLILWEILFRKYPYRFYSETNKALRCNHCEKQCFYRGSDR